MLMIGCIIPILLIMLALAYTVILRMRKATIDWIVAIQIGLMAVGSIIATLIIF